MNNSFAFIVQARSQSTRLPNKILLPFYKAETILDIQLKNLQQIFPAATLILATSTNKADDIIENKYGSQKGITVFRGDEQNVLKRFVDAANKHKVEHIVRICSDNPFLSMQYIRTLMERYFISKPDYLSYGFSNGLPAIKSHTGLFAEAVNLNTLKKVQQLTSDPLYCEHVTNYIYSHPEMFRVEFIAAPAFINELVNSLRLTIDTNHDFENLQKLYLSVLSKHGDNYSVEQLIEEIKNNIALMAFMKEQIRQHAK